MASVHAPEPVQPTALLRLPDVMRRTGLKKTALYTLMQRSAFPLAVSLAPGSRMVAWRAADVDIWIAARTAPLSDAEREARRARARRAALQGHANRRQKHNNALPGETSRAPLSAHDE